MRKSAAIFCLLTAAIFSLCALEAQSISTGSDRKVVNRVAPTYPELAKKMHIQGTVKLEATVRANGSVKSTRVIGGNPVLVEAASDAVMKWKFSPGPNDTTEIVQLSFEGQ